MPEHAAEMDRAHAEAASGPALAHHFEDLEQQHEAGSLGMWAFLATEVMFFGGLFAAYTVYRSLYFEAFVAASRDQSVILGAINTAVLLTSSLTMALAVRSAQLRRRGEVVRFLVATMVLGAAFLGIKSIEYTRDYHESLIPGPNFRFEPEHLRPHAMMYFVLYFLMTGLHAIHLIIGIVAVGVVATLVARRPAGRSVMMVELTGLYWHFIDLVWVFLYPLLYLIDVRR